MSKRICAFCEYFDGGGEARVARAIRDDASLDGDCLCPRSSRLQTSSKETCSLFLKDPRMATNLANAGTTGQGAP